MKTKYIVVQLNDYTGFALEFSNETLALLESIIPVRVKIGYGDPVRFSRENKKEYPLYLIEAIEQTEE